jgi:isoquinoline 1-oxidoreductase beta subunit
MTAMTNLSRRGFIAASGTAAGGLALGFALPLDNRLARATGAGGGRLNAFITIAPDGSITFYSPFIEMGQGTYTSLPQIVAEELDAPMAAMRVEQAPHGDDYKIMFGGTQRFTGGSLSVRSSYDTLRKVGAAARAMLIEAAAGKWGLPRGDLTTEPGHVVHAASGRRASYGELAAAAAELTPPDDPPLKEPGAFRLIGKPVKRTDMAAKSNGSAIFGIDVKVPGMVYAAVRQSPVFGGEVSSFDAAAIKGMPGVIAVDTVPNGVAVVADRFWRAKSALAALPVTFEGGKAAGFTSEDHAAALRARTDEPGRTAEDKGDVAAAFGQAAQTLEAVYHAPFLAHVTMEPMNATAEVTAERCTVWAPNQGADASARVAARITGLPLDRITVVTPYLGGGYGRRFMQDFTAHAVTLAKKIGRPVKVVWTREEDIRHDHYRPQTVAKHRAALDGGGRFSGWHTTLVGEGPIGRHMPQAMEEGLDPTILDGAWKQPHAVDHRRVDWVEHRHPTPIGFWRSVPHSFNGFFTESFIDEVAHAAGIEPVEFRRRLLQSAPRYLKVLETIVEMASYRPDVWTEDGTAYAMGVAVHESFGSIVGQVAKVSIAGGQPVPHHFWCAVDCGSMVNPEIIVAQMESGISTGLSQALLEEIEMEDGRVVQSNFDTYRILPPHLMPQVEVRIIESGAKKGGIGEPGTPPAAPALANAAFKLTGERIRRLPFARYRLALKDDLRSG